MRNMALLVCAAMLAAAPVNKPEDKAGDEVYDKTLVAHAAESWLKVYTLPIYEERWSLEVTVRDMAKDMPRLRQVFAKAGASLAGPAEEAARTRRLSYRCSQNSARRALQDLKNVGSFAAPIVRPFIEPVSRSEVQDKIAALEADKAAHGGELARMPAVSTLVEELLGHLRSVEKALRRPEAEVLIHLNVREKG